MEKGSVYLHDINVKPEIKPLALVHIDLQGPSIVKLAEGALYMIILIDNATSF